MRYLAVVLAVTLLSACAKIVPPDGGDRDTEAPRDTIMVPRNLSTNFTSSRVYIEFNEYVRLNDIYNQLVVSPPLNEKPEIKVRRKSVIIDFQEELLPNVTYTMNFGEGIVDVTEGNPAENLNYVFATGQVLDSLTLSGQVVDAFSGAPVEGARVMLYRSMEDSLPRTTKPYYFTRTNVSGEYQFQYLGEGEYQLFAIAEGLPNYLFDLPDEQVAFLNEPVSPDVPSARKELPLLRLSQEIDTLQFVESYASDSSGFLRVKMSKPFANRVPIEVSNLRGENIQVWFEDPDSIYVWSVPPYRGETEWRITAGNNEADTLLEEAFSHVPETMTLRSKLPASVRSDEELLVRFDLPVDSLNSFRASALKDSIPLVIDLKRTDDPFAVKFDLPLEAGESYEITLLPNAISGYDQASNDTLVWAFTTFDESHYGNLNLKVLTDDMSPCVLQLINREGQVIAERAVEGPTRFNFPKLLPGVYRLRMFIDENGNGVWDPASFSLRSHPEMMFNMPEDISIRSNWDVELEWDLK